MKYLTKKLPSLECVRAKELNNREGPEKQNLEVPAERRLFMVDQQGTVRPITVYTTSKGEQLGELEKALMAMQYATSKIVKLVEEPAVKPARRRMRSENQSNSFLVCYDWFYTTRKTSLRHSNLPNP